MKYRIENKDIIPGKDKSVKALCNKAKKLIPQKMGWYNTADAYLSKGSIPYVSRICFTNFELISSNDKLLLETKLRIKLKNLEASSTLKHISSYLVDLLPSRQGVIIYPCLTPSSAFKLKSLLKQVKIYERMLRQQVSFVLRNYSPIVSTTNIETRDIRAIEEVRFNYKKLKSLIQKLESFLAEVDADLKLIGNIDLNSL